MKLCILPRVEGIGGMASFRYKFEQGLRARGVEVTHDADSAPDAILVIAGTKNLAALYRAKRRGARIVQRLDGMNWVHRKRNTGLRHFLRAEYGNFILSFIRKYLADAIIYQSEFSRAWWQRVYGETSAPAHVILNGVDLNAYSPAPIAPPAPPYRILLVEGNLGGGYEMGLDNALALTEALAAQHQLDVELIVAGQIEAAQRERATSRASVPVQWRGAIPREEVPALMRSCHLLFSADLHPACPNVVIEALACGLPVAAFDTGAVSELVIGGAGRVVPYGTNSWNIEPPRISPLADAAREILLRRDIFSQAARKRAEDQLGLERMTGSYLNALAPPL
ncbi:MAG: hypothetical protein Fur002_13860 [Anaerolineales bacterium]